jgi:putative membrane protein
MSSDKISLDRFVIMERKLFYGIMTPGGIITIVSGVWLWLDYGFSGLWLNIKLLLVLLLVIYHLFCFKFLLDFKREDNKRSHVFYRWFNEVPVVLLIAIVLLVELKPL